MAIRKSSKKSSDEETSCGSSSQEDLFQIREAHRPRSLERAPSSPPRPNGRGVRASSELNAFIELPKSRFTEQILDQNRIDFVRENGHLVVYGNGAFKFANMFNAETRRPMRHGLVNAGEPYAQRLLEVIVEKLVGKPKTKGELLCFSVPGPPRAAPSSPRLSRSSHETDAREHGFRSKVH